MKRSILSPISLFTAFLLSMSLIIGCDSLGSGDGGGTVQVLLTDAPIDNIAEAIVTIERVELVGDAGVVVIMEEEETYDLLELQNGITAELGEAEVPAGEYHQIRLIVQEEATLVFDDGTESTLKIPSGAQTGIKLNLPGGFEIGDGAEDATILLDFDASKSFVKAGASGMYIFKPVVKVESVEIDGEEVDDGPEITGEITAVTETTVEIEGISLALAEETDIDADDGDSLLVVGAFVEADLFEQSDGSYAVLEIERSDDDEVTVEAPLEEVLTAAVVALGTSFDISAGTEFEGISGLTDLEAGNFVEITFTYDASSDTYTASKIDFEEDDEEDESEEDEDDADDDETEED